MNAASKACAYASALGWFRRVLDMDIKPCAIEYNTLMNAAINSDLENRLDIVENLYQEMIDSQISRDRITFGTMLSAASAVGDVAKASEWFDTMVREGIKPNMP